WPCFLAFLIGAHVNLAAGEVDRGDEEDASFQEWLRGDDLDDFSEFEAAELDELLAPLSVWDVETSVSTGSGYRDNVLGSAVESKGSAFLLGGFESTVLHVGEGPTFSLFLEAEHLEFLQ